MGLLRVWVATDKVGSLCEQVIEVPDEDIEDLDEQSMTTTLGEYAEDVLWSMLEWGFELLDEEGE